MGLRKYTTSEGNVTETSESQQRKVAEKQEQGKTIDDAIRETESESAVPPGGGDPDILGEGTQAGS